MKLNIIFVKQNLELKLASTNPRTVNNNFLLTTKYVGNDDMHDFIWFFKHNISP